MTTGTRVALPAGVAAEGDGIAIGKPAYASTPTSTSSARPAADVTERAVERGVSGTPSVSVAGTPVPANGRTIAAAVPAVAR